MAVAPDRPLPDARLSWVERAPASLRPYMRLARYDRPIGIWLLAGPSWLGMALANIDGTWSTRDMLTAVLLGVGSIAMRGAGCTFNDMVDKDLDAQVARTANRPLAAGTLTMKAAWAFLLLQCLVGLAVLLTLPPLAQIVALASIPVVAAYPFMKRITWFPQAWLGIALNWGVLVGFAAVAGALRLELWLLFAGLACWTFGYDTIYAHQDKEDDALIGVKSTARFFGKRSADAISVAYVAAIGFVLAAGVAAAVSAPTAQTRLAYALSGVLTACAFGAHLQRQAAHVLLDDGASCLKHFKSNRDAILIAVAVLALFPLALHPLTALLA